MLQYVIFTIGIVLALVLGLLHQESVSRKAPRSFDHAVRASSATGLGSSSPVVNNPAEDCKSDMTRVPTVSKIKHSADILSAHAVSADYLSNGDVFAVWFAGSREGAKDVKIFSARYQNSRWSAPQAIADITNTTIQTARYQRKVGNPAIIHHHGKLYLFYVAVSVGGWAGSRLFVKTSLDQGQHWSPAKILYSNAFFNLSTLVHHRPISLNERYILIPAYHELAFKNPEWIIFDSASLEIVDRYRPDARGYLQPAFNRSQDNSIQAWYRVSRPLKYIGYQVWDTTQAKMKHTAVPTSLPNPNAGIATERLSDSCTLLALNPQLDSRDRLGVMTICGDPLALSSREVGHAFQTPAYESSDHRFNASTPSVRSAPLWWLENTLRQQEFSYPAVIKQADNIDVLYTWKRKNIAHQRIAAVRMLPDNLTQNFTCLPKP